MQERLSCFKAYDIRGRVPDDLDTDLAQRIGRSFASWLRGDRVVIGHDIRLSSPEIKRAVVAGLLTGGAHVHDIGLCGTEEMYFAVAHYGMDGGIMITASHNPRDHNGMKLVRDGARPISGDTGLREIERMAAEESWTPSTRLGTKQDLEHRITYLRRLLSFVDVPALEPLRVVVNPGNGGAGVVLEALEPHLPFALEKMQYDPDGHFPNGVPNPLLEENRAETSRKVVENGADFGVAWDGDFDRCFFFDETGRFVDGYYIVGLLAEAFLRKSPGEKIIHDPRLTWNTRDICRQFTGRPIQSKTGHAFIKERMRTEKALYGGEMSGHHYFRDFDYCDSGMIPWLLVAELVGRTGKPLSQLLDERIERFPVSGEINRCLDDPLRALERVERLYGAEARAVDHTDGLAVELDGWRFNLRMSNTEPVVRLNVESDGDRALMERKTRELIQQLDGGVSAAAG